MKSDELAKVNADLRWRNIDDRDLIWCVEDNQSIAGIAHFLCRTEAEVLQRMIELGLDGPKNLSTARMMDDADDIYRAAQKYIARYGDRAPSHLLELAAAASELGDLSATETWLILAEVAEEGLQIGVSVTLH